MRLGCDDHYSPGDGATAFCHGFDPEHPPLVYIYFPQINFSVFQNTGRLHKETSTMTLSGSNRHVKG